MKKKKKLSIALSSLAALFILYFILINFLVSAALVPSFMEKLESFQRISDESFAALVQTTDIKTNRQLAKKETEEWLKTAKSKKISVESQDGYTLAAEEFYAQNPSHKWVLLLHGYTGWKEEMFPFVRWYQK